MSTDPNPNNNPDPEQAPANGPEQQSTPAPEQQATPAPERPDDSGTLADLREAVSSLTDVVTDIVSEVRSSAGDDDATPEKLPWHKRKWF